MKFLKCVYFFILYGPAKLVLEPELNYLIILTISSQDILNDIYVRANKLFCRISLSFQQLQHHLM